MESKDIFDLQALLQKKTAFSGFFAKFAVFRPLFGKGKIILVVLIGLLFVSEYFLVYVQPNEFGIKVVRIGLEKGVQKEIYTPGYQFVIPGFQEMITIPRDVQVLELTNFPGTASNEARAERAAHIQTSDGFYVSVDVSIIYKIADPYLVVTTIGPGRLFEDNGIIPKTEPALKATLGELTTEEFFNSPLRVKKTEQAKNMLNAELLPKGIHVEQVLVRYFKYSDEIQRNIEQKKLKDQLVFKNQAEGRAAREEAILKKIVQEGKATVVVEMEGGNAYVTKRNAERDRYVRTKNAEADLLVKLAEAERVRLKNVALQGMGSERMVGLKMAEVYKGLDIVILPSDGATGINPLDLNKTLQLFEVREGGNQ
jgi:regulator of protease activity HflC (stomatin/prohibitin superfamily)